MTPAERLARIRVYIANGGRASWPRDAFESVPDWIDEKCGE